VLRIVDDQVSSPTWARMLAEATAQVIAQGRDDSFNYLAKKSGLYHLAGGGFCSRYEWAKATLELDPKKEKQVVKKVLPARTSDFPTAANRPMNTSLNTTKFSRAFTTELPTFQNILFLSLSNEN